MLPMSTANGESPAGAENVVWKQANGDMLNMEKIVLPR